VRDQACQISILIEDNSIWPWAAAAVDFLRGQDRKLIVRPADREGEALVVVVPAFISDWQTLTIGTNKAGGVLDEVTEIEATVL
jgi:hypothetical protein